ncbi:MAG: hypothetical protein WA857_11825 [Candidatus Acidiferrum sp.]
MNLKTNFVIFLFLCAAPTLSGQAFKEEVGYLAAKHDRISWPAPELIVENLRSKNPQVRLEALRLLGVEEEQAHDALWSQTSPSKTTGETVVTPDQIELTYAALGDDMTQQALIALQLSKKQLTFAAIATPKAKGWERVAVFYCWCKYEMYRGRNSLAEFVQLRPVPGGAAETPERFELVLRASGGGTGIYTQNEAHFRIHNGRIDRLIDFVSRSRSCDPTGPMPQRCTIERRWLYPTTTTTGAAWVLVTGRGEYQTEVSLSPQMDLNTLETRYLSRFSCRTYIWDENSFNYVRLTNSKPCFVPPEHSQGRSSDPSK